VKDFVTGQWTLIPLAGPANRQGRIGGRSDCRARLALPRHAGHVGSARSLRARFGQTGASEKLLTMLGDTDFEKVHIYQNSHAGYYPARR